MKKSTSSLSTDRTIKDSSLEADLLRVKLIPLKSTWTCPKCSYQNTALASEMGGDGQASVCGVCMKHVLLGVSRVADDDLRKVLQFAATSLILFAHHRNVVEGDYFRCLRCDGESLHGRAMATGNVAHYKGCPVALAGEMLAVSTQPEDDRQATTEESHRPASDPDSSSSVDTVAGVGQGERTPEVEARKIVDSVNAEHDVAPSSDDSPWAEYDRTMVKRIAAAIREAKGDTE